MENISKTIKEKLQFLTTDKSKALRKVFTLSVESLQDNPRKIFAEIEEYISLHREKIEDFHFETYVDENTFAPTLVLHVIPIKSIREGMINSFWENLTTIDIRPFTISEKIEKIFQSFTHELNTPEIRQQLCFTIEQLLKTHTPVDFKIVDITENENHVMIAVDHEEGIKNVREFLCFLCDRNLLSKQD